MSLGKQGRFKGRRLGTISRSACASFPSACLPSIRKITFDSSSSPPYLCITTFHAAVIHAQRFCTSQLVFLDASFLFCATALITVLLRPFSIHSLITCPLQLSAWCLSFYSRATDSTCSIRRLITPLPFTSPNFILHPVGRHEYRRSELLSRLRHRQDNQSNNLVAPFD